LVSLESVDFDQTEREAEIIAALKKLNEEKAALIKQKKKMMKSSKPMSELKRDFDRKKKLKELKNENEQEKIDNMDPE
jgi:hypothetical protein